MLLFNAVNILFFLQHSKFSSLFWTLFNNFHFPIREALKPLSYSFSIEVLVLNFLPEFFVCFFIEFFDWSWLFFCTTLFFCLIFWLHQFFLSKTSLVSPIPAFVLSVVFIFVHLSLCLSPYWRPFSIIVLLYSTRCVCLPWCSKMFSCNANNLWLSIHFHLIFDGKQTIYFHIM